MRSKWMGTLLASMLLASAVQAAEVQGKADVPFENGFFSKGPDTKLRQQGIAAAKANAWNRYTATFNPARMKSYKLVQKDILANIDDFIIDYSILDEGVNKDTQLFSIAIRANINEAALDARLNTAGNGPASASSGQMFSFVFVARETATLKSFDDRKTSINMDESALNAKKSGGISGGGASVAESQTSMTKTTTGGSTLRQADDRTYRVRSGADVDVALTETLTGNGFEVVGYPDVYSNCGGPAPDLLNKEFSASDDMTPGSRSAAIASARSCEVKYFSVGTLDIGLSDVDPVTGNKRVYVSVRSQVWDISSKLPRRVASVGPIQYAGLGPDAEVASRNALRLAATSSAKTMVDQLNSKGAH
ncbi:MAG: hypothetical protein ACOH2R_09355 [Pseudomonas sp.]